MLPLTYCRKTVVKGGMVSHVGYHDTISVKVIYLISPFQDHKYLYKSMYVCTD
jgi:hypothetical protein